MTIENTDVLRTGPNAKVADSPPGANPTTGYAANTYTPQQPVVPSKLQGFDVVSTGNNKSGASLTGLANNATVYTATVVINGVSFPLSLTGSANQTYGALMTNINLVTIPHGVAQIVPAGGPGNMRITAADLGIPHPTVAISDTGPNLLFASLTGFTGFSPFTGDLIVDASSFAQMLNVLNELVDHTHIFYDDYSTACNCNCNCACTRGIL